MLRCAGQLDSPIAFVVGVLLEGLQRIRLELRILIPGIQAASQLAILLAIRELRSATILNESVHVVT